MKKFILGVVSTLGAIGVGKIVYNKGRKDQARDLKESFDNVQKGIIIGEKSREESKQ